MTTCKYSSEKHKSLDRNKTVKKERVCIKKFNS